MSRKNWSNLLLLLALVNPTLAVVPANPTPVKIFGWMALPFFLMLSARLRRRMI